MPEIEFDAATLAQTIRDQKALPIADNEAETIARALETWTSPGSVDTVSLGGLGGR